MNINKIDGWGETPKELFEELMGKYITPETASYDVFEGDDVWTFYLERRPVGAPDGPVFNNEAMECILWLREGPTVSRCLEQVIKDAEPGAYQHE